MQTIAYPVVSCGRTARRSPSWFPATLLLFGVAACSSSSDDAVPQPARPDNPSRVIGAEDPLPGIVLAITGVTGASGSDGSFAVGDVLTVRYTAHTAGGDPLDVADLDTGSIFVSGPTFNYQRVIAEQTDLRSASVYEGDGTWSYTFVPALPASYLAPLNDSTSFTVDELTGQGLIAGTYTVGLAFSASYTGALQGEWVDAGNATADFLIGSATTLAPRAVVQSDNCNVCHSDLRVHDGVMREVGMCVLCHTAGAEDSNEGDATPGVTIEFKVMVHKLHNAAHLPSVLGVSTDNDGNRLYPGDTGAVDPVPLVYVDGEGSSHDYSEIHFPLWPNLNIAMPRDGGYSLLSSTDPDGSGPLLSQRSNEDTIRMGVTTCAKCHGDPDASGPMAAPAQGGLAYSQPTRRACGSCHDDIDWDKPYIANGATMPAQPDDTQCIVCHTGYASNQGEESLKKFSVHEGHLHPLVDATVDPGVDSVITAVTGGSGTGGNFQVGDTPTITFTLKNDAGDDIGISTMDSCAGFFFGPTGNPQLIMPTPSPSGLSLSPYDFTGRLHSSSTSNKGAMSKVFQSGSAAAETLLVQFTSSTAFTVSRIDPEDASVLGVAATSALPGAASTNPSGSSVSAIELDPALAAGTFQIAFTSATEFEITGAVSGTGELPAATSASTRFESSDISFNIAVGSTPFAAGNTIFGVLVRGDSANPVLFAIIAGRTAFATGDRFYYEVVPDAASYTLKMPMDLVYEDLGDTGGSPSPGTAMAAAGNLPVYYGRQLVYEAATTATTTTTTADIAALDRSVEVNGATGFANNDVVVIEPASGIGTREFVAIAPARADGVIAASGDTTTKLYFKTPLRYAHTAPVTITKVTLTFQQEGSKYTLNPQTGVITSVSAFTASRTIVMSYRSDARFGYKRHSGDSFQTTYVPPANDGTELGQEQGDWQGLAYQDGTYTVDIWCYKNIELGREGELQTYRSTSDAGTIDFLYGSATTIEPRQIISESANCYTCHDDVIFHGGGRRGFDACLTCHAISAAEDKPRWDTAKVSGTSTDTALTPGVSIEFREMLHKIHKGAELAYGDEYTVVGYGGTPHTYGEVEFPAMPRGVMQCDRCHGNDAWKQPADRVHTSSTLMIKKWTIACGSCHDSDSAQAHIASQSTAFGTESCDICHSEGREAAVEHAHLPR